MELVKTAWVDIVDMVDR